MKSKRTQATDISKEVKQAVAERDSYDGCPCCIFCGSPNGLPEAHYIPRSQNGLGIEENILTTCRDCHRKLDQSTERESMMTFAKAYLQEQYPYWNENILVYRKGES